MKKIVLVVSLISSIGLYGCDDENRPPLPNEHLSTGGHKSYSSVYTQIEGCTIYSIDIPNRMDMYLSKCNDAADSSVTFKSGKVQITNLTNRTVVQKQDLEQHTSDDIGEAASHVANKIHRNQSDEDRILELADQIKERRTVLDKLTEHDREILGLESTEVKVKHNDN